MRRILILLAAILIPLGTLPCGLSDACAREKPAGTRNAKAVPLTRAPAPEQGLVALDQALKELTNPFTVMSVAAHPEDVDYGTLAYYRKKLGARTAIVFVTRGEAGRRADQHDPDENRGVARTREAARAARLLGADAYFLNLRDFGEAKTPEEVFSVWGHQEALGRMVRAIRSIRPDVIITDHDPETGEGQHRATARLTLEAFEAASDARKFVQYPDREGGDDFPAWQVRRIFRRSFKNTIGVMINLNEYDHLRGRTYAQIAREAKRNLRPQLDREDHARSETERNYYQLARSAYDEKALFGGTLFDGLLLPDSLRRSLEPPRVAQTAATQYPDRKGGDSSATRARMIESLREKLIEKRAEGSLKEIQNRYGAEFHRMVRFIEGVERALGLALGISFEITLSDTLLVAGQKVTARLSFHNGSSALLPLAFHTPESLPAPGHKPAYKVSEVIQAASNQTISKEIEYELPKDAPLTLPHSDHLYEENHYRATNKMYSFSAPSEASESRPFGNRLIALAEIGLGPTVFSLSATVRFDVAPPVEISTIPFALIKNWSEARDFRVDVRLRNRTPGELAGALWVVPLAITVDEYEPVHVRFALEDQEIRVRLNLKLPILRPPLVPDILIEFRREKPAPPTPLASSKITVLAAEFTAAEGIRVGYIRGFDDWLALALAELGVEHRELTLDEISAFEHGHTDQAKAATADGCARLAVFDTIIVDELATAARPELDALNRCLLEYARRGGNLIVFYQRPKDWTRAASGPPAPFPIKLSNKSITVEAAPVKIISQDHPLMRKPNEITEKDFEGWTKDRAHYLPEDWAVWYTALLESADPGEEAQRGGLLAARYEGGTYVYVSYDLRQQSLSANKGAYRLLANLISLAKTIKEPSGDQK
ncbi:MAG: PIG-L family deacetylase [Blastocatellia bacterium]|nr:PIG-L family deacetylase [Blastocatellia bacterium]